MKQKTAMQTLITWGDEMLLKHPQKILSFAEAIDKAEELLQMEKQQIMKAYKDYHNLGHIYGLETELYYNENFNAGTGETEQQ